MFATATVVELGHQTWRNEVFKTTAVVTLTIKPLISPMYAVYRKHSLVTRGSNLTQGSYRSWKVLLFKSLIFRKTKHSFSGTFMRKAFPTAILGLKSDRKW